MNDRKVFAYRLIVTIPPQCQTEGFVPEPLRESSYRDYESEPFTWPRRRLYFDWTAATKRASLLRSWGARVIVEKAHVNGWEYVKTWGDGEPE